MSRCLLLYIAIAASFALIRILRTTFCLPLPSLYIFPPHFALLEILIVLLLVSRVVHTDHPSADSRTSQIIHGQIGAPLVFIFQPAETPALARLAVARQLEENRLAELGEDCDDIAFGKLIGEAAEVDKGGVAVVDVPGGVGGAGQQRGRG